MQKRSLWTVCSWALLALGLTVALTTCCNPSGLDGDDLTGDESTETPADPDRVMEVFSGGYVNMGRWHGKPYTLTEGTGTTINPAVFDRLEGGDPLHVSGTVSPDPHYGSYALLAIPVNQGPDDTTLGQVAFQIYGRTTTFPYWISMNT